MIIVFLSIAAIAAGTWAFTLRSKVSSLTEELSSLTEELSAKTTVCSSLQNYVDDLQTQHNHCVDANMEASVKIKQLNSTIQSLNDKAKAKKALAKKAEPVAEVATMSAAPAKKRTYKKKANA